jgi:AcrR family transcriptional regulator
VAQQDEKTRSTADAILDAAIDRFVADGFEGTSMDSIALAAGVAKGTLYYHYNSKEGIVDATLERYARRVERVFKSIESDLSLGVMDRLIAMTAGTIQVNIDTFSKLHRMRGIDIHKRTNDIILACFTPYYARAIAAGNAAGQWSAPDPERDAEILLAASLVLLDPEEGEALMPARVDALVTFMERGFAMAPGTLAPVQDAFMRMFSPDSRPGGAARGA